MLNNAESFVLTNFCCAQSQVLARIREIRHLTSQFMNLQEILLTSSLVGDTKFLLEAF